MDISPGGFPSLIGAIRKRLQNSAICADACKTSWKRRFEVHVDTFWRNDFKVSSSRYDALLLRHIHDMYADVLLMLARRPVDVCL